MQADGQKDILVYFTSPVHVDCVILKIMYHGLAHSLTLAPWAPWTFYSTVGQVFHGTGIVRLAVGLP